MNHHLFFLRTVARSVHRLYRWMLIATLTMASPVWALNCNWITSNPTAYQENLAVNISNNGAPVQVGADNNPTLSYFAQFQTPTAFSYGVFSCTSGTNYIRAQTVGGSTALGTAIDGRSSYLTNVPGVGVEIYSSMLQMPPSPAVSSYPLANGSMYAYNGTGFEVAYRFFRLAGQRVGTGIIDGASLPQVQHYAGDLLLYTAQAVGQLKIVGLTCNVSNVSVDLGTATLSQFQGVGLPISSAPVPFAMTAGNCPAGMVAVSVSLAASTGSYSNGVAALTADSTAKGVGIQILDNTGNPVSFNSNYPLPYNSATGGTVKQNFSARYFQLSKPITGGTAKTLLTYTMTYL